MQWQWTSSDALGGVGDKQQEVKLQVDKTKASHLKYQFETLVAGSKLVEILQTSENKGNVAPYVLAIVARVGDPGACWGLNPGGIIPLDHKPSASFEKYWCELGAEWDERFNPRIELNILAALERELNTRAAVGFSS
ncbi:hypothetical protein DFJ73DRAFT_764583 [Zopfochytrium polystomum]|nr:hypothetical protein DFJ73DRAFT_764583 [Zopfochytrium polystomum]